MTKVQKETAKRMRAKGESYGTIAKSLGVSENTIKSFCRRNNISAAKISGSCQFCGNSLKHPVKRKQKKFCSDKCRMAWWNAHPDAVDKKAVYNFCCQTCGKPFIAYGNKSRKFCSHSCYINFRFGKAANV